MRRTVAAAAFGASLGGGAALVLACAEYGAHWLWVERWDDRVLLLLRMLGLLVPLGAALGAVLGGLLGATEGLIERAAPRRRVWLRSLRVALITAPAAVVVGRLLFTGGAMTRLSGRAWLVPATIAVLLGSSLAAAYVAHRMADRAETRRRSLALAGALLALTFAVGKLNQWVLPKLYDYLHASLSAVAFASVLGALWLLAQPKAGMLSGRALALAGAPLLGLGGLLFPFTLDRLDQNQNVRVALMHPNVPSMRAVMQALGPLVLEPRQLRATAEARARARLARRAHGSARAQVSGPTFDDAHVLLLTIDALRPDHLGYYGYERPTSPSLDRLAAESVVLERTYAQAPHSSYSLCSIMTSEYLHETLDLGNPAPEATLATALGAAGYHTAAFYSDGIFHTEAERLRGYERSAFGFALYDHVTYVAEELTERVLSEVDRSLARGEPNTLLWAHYFDVHEPYRSTRFGERDIDRYDGEIRHVDGEVQRLVQQVRARFTRPVIVVLSADHGEEFREHGGVYHGSSLYDEQVRVPLVINAPGLAPRRIATPAETIDIAPTILGLLGLGVPESMRGRDLRADFGGAQGDPRPVFSAVIHKKMVVRWPYKLIADLRFGLYELYDLQRDPRERENLADRDPARVAALRADIYAWLDSLAPRNQQRDTLAAALEWGRLRDRRAVEPLSKLVQDGGADRARRTEAARLLGILADERAAPSLARAAREASEPRVAAEAAIALGRMYDPRARDALRSLVAAEDPDLRVRAAVSLGRLRDPAAVPGLIEALWIAEGDYERQEAVRWLGRIRDRRAIEPLLHVLPQQRTRFLVVTALGLIGDARAYEPLAEVLAWDTHPDVREGAVRGLGLLGDPRAIGPVLRSAEVDATNKLAGETLVRLGAIAQGAIGGLDVSQRTVASDELGHCHEADLFHDWDYQQRTHCTTKKDVSKLWLELPESVARAPLGTVALVSVKRVDARAASELRLRAMNGVIGTLSVDGNWTEHRVELGPDALPAGRVALWIEGAPGARFAVDHVLLIPRTTALLAQAP